MLKSAPVLFFVYAASLFAAGEPYLTEPSICPTRPEIAFVSAGDIWVAPEKGGAAHILVSNPADESRPIYSPDGTKLAFVSTRTGNGDIYVLTLATGDLKRITFDDGLDQLDAWSRDGRWLYFSNGTNDVGRKNDIYRVSSEGGTPMPVTADRFTNEFQGAPSPDGASLAFAARGVGDSQWWRNGHSHLDESEIWLRKEGSPAAYEKIVDLNGRNAWPMWAPDGKALYFMSDRVGKQNIWAVALGDKPGGKPRQITKFTTGRVLWPSIAYDGKAIVFERDFRVWRLDIKTGEAQAVAITLDGVPGSPEPQHLTLTQFTEMALSPDGRKIAMAAHGDIFASARDGGDTIRVTESPAPESQATWSPDSQKVAYLSPRDAVNHIFLHDFAAHSDTQITNAKTADQAPKFSPDGKSLAFVRDHKELLVYDFDGKHERSLYTGFLGSGGPGGGAGTLAWSPDSKWIAFVRTEERGLRNIYALPAAGGTARPVTFLSNGNVGSVEWSPDGKFLLFETNQRTEEAQVTRVDLTPRLPKFTEEKLDDLFKPEPPRSGGRGGAAAAAEVKPPAPVSIDFDDIRERASAVPVGLSAQNLKISPDGHWLVFSAAVGGQSNLYLYPLDETAPGAGGRGGRGGGGQRGPRQLTSTAGAKSRPQFSPDSREVYYLEGGRIQAMTIDTRVARAINVNAEMTVDFNKEKIAAFEQAWAGQRDGFWDAEFNGADWNAVRRTYAPLIEAAHTPDEMRRILRMMIGELNSSHSGVSAPTATAGEAPAGPRAVTGQLGLSFDRAEYESTGKLKITAVLPHSPAALAGVKAGGELQSVDGAAVGANVNLDALLERKIGKRVVLKISGSDVTVQPVASLADQIYRNWVEENRAYVAKKSGGRLGYVHMRDMSDAALTQFYMDLDSENRAKDGVVIDIRNNNGGFVNAYALDVLTRRPYLTMTARGGPQGPARTVLGQRSLELPTILVVNQHSLSDAEDFTEGYRTLKLGKVVGEPTAGWIVYTGSMDLVDGSVMRMPGTLIRGSDGKNMENNPRPVDIAVTRPIGESYTGRDSQLDAAVKELLAEVPGK
jgi:tricorn protease